MNNYNIKCGLTCMFAGIVSIALLSLGVSASYAQGVSNQGSYVPMQAEVEAYWTPKRMENAEPMSTHRITYTAEDGVSATAGLPEDAVPMMMPGWHPKSGLPVPDKTSIKLIPQNTQRSGYTPQPLTFGSPPSNPTDYANYGKHQLWTWYGRYLTYPTSIHGKLFFSDGNGDFVCSGTVSNKNTVTTAGHCVSDGNGTFYTNFSFCPSYNKSGENTTTGCWGVDLAVTTSDWHQNTNVDRDYGCLVTKSDGGIPQGPIGDTTGWAGYAVNLDSDQMTFSFGYPAASPFQGWHIIVNAATEWYAIDSGGADALPIGNTNQVSKYMGNTMTGGSSGGGWLLNVMHNTEEYTDVDGSDITDPGHGQSMPLLNGVNSHKRCRINCNEPPNAIAGVFWSEMGSPQFIDSATDTEDYVDILNNCLANGGD